MSSDLPRSAVSFKTCASHFSGPLHGGANEAVIRMLISIGKSVDHDLHLAFVLGPDPAFRRPENVPAFIEAVKRREKTLSGFGHR